MGNTQSLKGVQQEEAGLPEELKLLREKRRSLEERTKVFEENARIAKLNIDKQLFVQILEEENRTHKDAIKDLEEKIADLEQQMKHSSKKENIQNETPSESAEETSSESAEETSDDIDALQMSAHELLQEPEPERSEPEAPLEAPKKKKRRGLF